MGVERNAWKFTSEVQRVFAAVEWIMQRVVDVMKNVFFVNGLASFSLREKVSRDATDEGLESIAAGARPSPDPRSGATLSLRERDKT